jgi:class 3 adenylate cyclase/pSer/pThr/pTyr-binding forkhead associated (FHA) protein
VPPPTATGKPARAKIELKSQIPDSICVRTETSGFAALMEQLPSKRLEELIRERARLDLELERYQRLLTILLVDIVGSTRFYDKHGDLAGLAMVQKCLDLLVPVIEQNGGIVVKTIGDAILARFEDAAAAARCAVRMQRDLADRDAGRATANRIHVRVAINSGLAFLKENDVFGDVVNVTSRIESATAPDEIAISPSVYEQIQHLPEFHVRKKAAGVELKGKDAKLDLYALVWSPDASAGPAPPRPSALQLAMATGLHAGLAEMAQQGAPGPAQTEPGEHPRPVVPQGKTAVLGSMGVEAPPRPGLQFVLARVRANGELAERYSLDQPGTIVGRQGSIRLPPDPLVAPEHARFTQLGDAVYVEDLGSPRGVFLRLRHAYSLRDGDVILIGQQRLRFDVVASGGPSAVTGTVVMGAVPLGAAPQASLVRLGADNQETDHYPLTGAETTLGRIKGTHVFPEDCYLSTTHARIRIQDSGYVLEDLTSTNGTFLRIRKRVLARDGDTLMIGEQVLRVLAEKQSPSGD